MKSINAQNSNLRAFPKPILPSGLKDTSKTTNRVAAATPPDAAGERWPRTR